MHDENPLIDVIVATVELAHRDANKPWACDPHERERIQRDAIAFLEWAQAEGRELAADLAHVIPHRAIRASRSWEMVADESTPAQLRNWKSHQRRRNAGRK